MADPLQALQKAQAISDPTANLKPTLAMMPLAPWGSSLLGAVRGLLGASKVAPELPQVAQPLMKTLGQLSPEFTAVGEEGAYNALRPVAKPVDALEQAYQRILQKGGR